MNRQENLCPFCNKKMIDHLNNRRDIIKVIPLWLSCDKCAYVHLITINHKDDSISNVHFIEHVEYQDAAFKRILKLKAFL